MWFDSAVGGQLGLFMVPCAVHFLVLGVKCWVFHVKVFICARGPTLGGL